MPDEPKPYPTANGAPEEPTFFCPFTAVYESGPAGTWIKKLAPCDIKNCALGHGLTDLCSILHICNMLDQLGGCVLQLRPAIERIAPLIEQHTQRLEAILRPLAETIKAGLRVLREFADKPHLEAGVSIARTLAHIHEDLERIAPPT